MIGYPIQGLNCKDGGTNIVGESSPFPCYKLIYDLFTINDYESFFIFGHLGLHEAHHGSTVNGPFLTLKYATGKINELNEIIRRSKKLEEVLADVTGVFFSNDYARFLSKTKDREYLNKIKNYSKKLANLRDSTTERCSFCQRRTECIDYMPPEDRIPQYLNFVRLCYTISNLITPNLYYDKPDVLADHLDMDIDYFCPPGREHYLIEKVKNRFFHPAEAISEALLKTEGKDPIVVHNAIITAWSAIQNENEDNQHWTIKPMLFFFDRNNLYYFCPLWMSCKKNCDQCNGFDKILIIMDRVVELLRHDGSNRFKKLERKRLQYLINNMVDSEYSFLYGPPEQIKKRAIFLRNKVYGIKSNKIDIIYRGTEGGFIYEYKFQGEHKERIGRRSWKIGDTIYEMER